MSQLLNRLIVRVTELERRQANIVRIGTIAEADYQRARVRVAIGRLRTAWLPWLTHRAAGDRSWHAPEVGEQVLVLAPSGELAAAVVIPAIYQTAHPAPADTPDLARLAFADGAVLEYDRAAHKLKAVIPGTVEVSAQGDIIAITQSNATLTASGDLTATIGGAATIESSGPATLKAPSVKIDSPATTITGTLTVAGLLTYAAGMAGSGSAPGGAAAIITGDLKTTGDVTADGISLKTHVHTEQGDGANTSAPHR